MSRPRGSLGKLDSTFTRAETALRVDLASAFEAQNEPSEAAAQASKAADLAANIGSVRQQRRIACLRQLTGHEDPRSN
jgi:hypothetical protein